MRALHPLARAVSEAFDEEALRAGLHQLADSRELVGALESLIVVAHRLSLRGDDPLAQRVIQIASESVPSLTRGLAASTLDRLAGLRQSIADVTGSRERERSFEPIVGGTAAHQLPSVRGLPRRA